VSRRARVSARASRHQTNSYACSKTQIRVAIANAASAGTATATGQSTRKATAVTKRPPLMLRVRRTRIPTYARR
jgi:hypothetical protein